MLLLLAALACAPVAPDLPGLDVDTEDAVATANASAADAGADPGLVDSDGDLVLDVDEGWDDPDGDGVPNALDLDSDGDGLLDEGEAGDRDVLTPPVDSDGDGLIDMLDLDSDDNCLPDAIEGQPLDGMPWNTDLRGLPDHADDDNDGDHIADDIELDGHCDVPLDSDGDGVADLWDLDSDNDEVPDSLETALDSDRDGVPNYLDLDSDDDGLSDTEEAGGALSCFGAPDADADCVPDFRDFDSDNDGVDDGVEVHDDGTDHRVRDTDEDGATDLVEKLAGTDPLVPGDAPPWIELPFHEPAEVPVDVDVPAGATLDVRGDTAGFVTSVAEADGAAILALYGVQREDITDTGYVLEVVVIDGGIEVDRAEVIVVVPTMPAGVSCIPR